MRPGTRLEGGKQGDRHAPSIKELLRLGLRDSPAKIEKGGDGINSVEKSLN